MDKNLNVNQFTIDSSFTFQSYQTFFSELVAQNSTTGENKTQKNIEYTKLNLHRAERIYKNAKLSNYFFENEIDIKDISWLIITEPWCGDAAHNLPILQKISEHLHIPTKIILRDSYREIMDQFLTNGTRSIPKLICYDTNTGNINSIWGPRPLQAMQIVLDAKKNNVPHDDYVMEVIKWYNADKTVSLQKEIFFMLKQCVHGALFLS